MQKSQPSLKTAHALFEQQMWCWGCDVRRAEGNLLLAYGFSKQNAPDPKLTSAYHLWLDPHTTLTLWGWGIWIAQQDFGSLLIQRAGFRLTGVATVMLFPQAWSEQALPLTDAPLAVTAQHQLALRAFHAIADYERWLSAQVDPHYRVTAITAWPQKRHHKGYPTDLAAAWSQLADHFTLRGS